MGEATDALWARIRSQEEAHRQTGDVSSLDTAIALCRQLLAEAGEESSWELKGLFELGSLYADRFSLTDDAADAKEAVSARRQVIARLDSDSSDYALCLADLIISLMDLFSLTARQAELDEAVSLGRAAVAELDPECVGYDWLLGHLGNACLSRFARVGDTVDLEDAVALFRKARDAAEDELARELACCLLGEALVTRFEIDGRGEDLTDAVTAYRQALEASLDDGESASSHGLEGLFAALADNTDAGRGDEVHRLATALLTRYNRFGHRADLDDAITAARHALGATPPDHPERAARAGRCFHLLLARADWQDWVKPSDLDDVITLVRHELTCMASGDPARPSFLAVLRASLLRRNARDHDPADLDEAIGASCETVELSTTPEDIDPMFFGGIAVMATDLAACLDKATDLDRTVRELRRALASLPSGTGRKQRHGWSAAAGNQVRVASSLAAALGERYLRTGDPEDRRQAVALAWRAVHTESATPAQRVAAARRGTRWAATAGEWDVAADLLAFSVSLMPRLTPYTWYRESRVTNLLFTSGVPRDAVAAAVRAGRPGEAVRLAEQGRGVLISQDLSIGRDLSVLREQNPGLAAQWTRLHLQRVRAERALQRLSSDVYAEFTETLDAIRALPALGHFASPSEPSALPELLAESEAGPVVLVNVSDYGSHALILAPGGVRTVELPEVTPETVHEQAGMLMAAGTKTGADPDTHLLAQRVSASVLAWLWDRVTGPVLDSLGLTDPPAPGHPWPRIWWVPTGMLALMPLHAAGDGRQNALDRVVSGYAPTINALRRARRRPPGPRPPHLLAVTMPQTPGASPLPGAAEEARMLATHVRRIEVLSGEKATYERVRARLPKSTWVHFACHTEGTTADTFEKSLLLHDHETHPLTVADLGTLNLDGAELAYLSACTTGAPGGTFLTTGESLADESIQLASAFLVAGYRHVIATLWPVKDSMAARFAEYFYTEAVSVGTDPAFALHQAARRIRDSYPSFPSIWASHIHTGP
ncbi:CHAT domain-containing protein [Streptomyces sp. IPPR8]|uniref:CHAT domain-containing tetratricopeptide repeat protein n=1 Tax=unclassified Streptomyces TaxID=2593676 RepID=UPI001B3673ED|nr:CHAT domain-containing protein [Streptomyces sp. RT42]MBQ0881946.1 CHAT domain-containing protein [Streptomyces sp. RT42]